MTDHLSSRLHRDLAERLDAAAFDRLIAANPDRWIAEAVADPTPLDQLDPLDAKITEALRELAALRSPTVGPVTP